MVNTLRDTRPQVFDALGQRFDTSLRLIARRSIRVWFNRGRLDQVLSENVGVCPHCKLLYAIDSDGHQVSSNIRTGAIDTDACGQDLSRQPLLRQPVGAEQRGLPGCVSVRHLHQPGKPSAVRDRDVRRHRGAVDPRLHRCGFRPGQPEPVTAENTGGINRVIIVPMPERSPAVSCTTAFFTALISLLP